MNASTICARLMRESAASGSRMSLEAGGAASSELMDNCATPAPTAGWKVLTVHRGGPLLQMPESDNISFCRGFAHKVTLWSDFVVK